MILTHLNRSVVGSVAKPCHFIRGHFNRMVSLWTIVRHHWDTVLAEECALAELKHLHELFIGKPTRNALSAAVSNRQRF